MKSTSLSNDLRGFKCKIGDFGLSRVLEHDSTTHISTRTYGTVLLPIHSSTCLQDITAVVCPAAVTYVLPMPSCQDLRPLYVYRVQLHSVIHPSVQPRLLDRP